jgi:hypothetical protein
VFEGVLAVISEENRPVLNSNSMATYKFETDQFGLSDNSIHLLRSGFNYDTIELSLVESISIDKGRQVNNWLILLIFGLGLSAFGLFTATKVIYEYFFADNFHYFYVEQFVIPVFPLFAGVLSIYYSLKNGPVLFVSTKSRSLRLPIGQLKDNSQIGELIDFLANNNFTKQIFRLKYKNANT